jgi:5-methyltetrahydropteroyltriglutamate--homocysteine methyltransferase
MIRVRTDHVGSLLRPATLVQARRLLEAGTLSRARLRAEEDRCIDRVVTQQEAAGSEVITDGEFRRLSFQGAIVEAVDGFGSCTLDAFLWGDWYGDGLEPWHRPRPQDLGVVGPLRRRRHFAADEYAYVRGRTHRIVKVTVPSPSLFANFWSADRAPSVYPSLARFLEAVTEILCEEVRELVRRGCRYIQLDAPHYLLVVDPRTRAFYERQGWSADEWLARGIELDNAVMAAAGDATFGFHLCRGNQGSRWLAAGSYEPVARQIFARLRAHRLLLEYDDERSGDFAPLRHVAGDTVVVLGLVTTKSARLETVAELASRVRCAAEVIGLDRLAISPQCGFASSIVGNLIGEADQFRKLARVAEAAAHIWG